MSKRLQREQRYFEVWAGERGRRIPQVLLQLAGGAIHITTYIYYITEIWY